MRERELKELVSDKGLLDRRIEEYMERRELLRVQSAKAEIEGHLAKAKHNLLFAKKSNEIGFPDWSIVGSYYACYHAALSLIMTRDYYSKNHMATLYILIKEFYGKVLDIDDMQTINTLLDYEDVLFYVEAKQKREDASYATARRFAPADAESLRVKASLFVSKILAILAISP
jgi:uncharacterized protein (UPF0332 family)